VHCLRRKVSCQGSIHCATARVLMLALPTPRGACCNNTGIVFGTPLSCHRTSRRGCARRDGHGGEPGAYCLLLDCCKIFPPLLASCRPLLYYYGETVVHVSLIPPPVLQRRGCAIPYTIRSRLMDSSRTLARTLARLPARASQTDS
jgi:hypothetical protein